MNRFPLYGNLDRFASDTPLSDMELIDFVRRIKKLDLDKMELVYVLIHLHYYYNDDREDRVNHTPYNGKQIKNDIRFNIDEFPSDLKHRIYGFLKLNENRS